MANREPMLLVAFWLGLILAATADQCQLDQLYTVASQQPNTSTISVNLPAGNCYATNPITISTQAAVTVTGVSVEGSRVGLGFLQNALISGPTGSRLGVSSLSLVDTNMGPEFMQLPMAVPNMTFTDVDILTDCWTVLQQQQLPQAKGLPQGLGYLYIANYTTPGLSAQRVNISCNLTQTVAQGVANDSSVLVADSSLSLYNAMVASSHMPGAPSVILVVADISVNRATFRQPVSLVRNTTFIGQSFLAPTWGSNNSTGMVNPMLDWSGYQKLVLINVKDVGVSFFDLDLMNTPPLTGVYYPRSGMAGAFTIPLWTFWYDPFSSSRGTMPIILENVRLVVPTAEYRWMLALAAAVISPLPDVTDAVATVKSFFLQLEVDQSSPRGILAFSRYWGLGINATQLRLANIPPPRITFPRLTDSSLLPTFSADVTKSPVLTTSINVYTAEDLVTGLAGLQAPSPWVDPVVNVILWRNVSLAEVVSQWPQGGFTLHTNITITGSNPTWYNPPMAMPAFTALDVAKLPHFLNIQPNKTSGIPNTLTFAWHTLLNLSMIIPDEGSPGNTTSFDSLCATSPDPWMVLGLNAIGMERVNGPAQYQGSTIIFQDASVVVPTYDLKLTAMLVRTSCVFGNATGGQDGSSMSSFDVLHTNSLYGARISITNLSPPGIANVYPDQPLLGSTPPPVGSDSGSAKLSTGAVVGIVVGIGVGLIAIGAAAALLFVHLRQKRRAKQHLETGNQPTAHKSQEGSDSTTMAVSQGRIHNNAQASARDQQPSNHKSGLEQAKGASGAIRVEGTPLDKLTDGSLHTSEAREAMAIAAATAAVTPSPQGSATPAAELQQVMAALANDIKDSHLTLLDAVGQGGFGTVYKGRWKGLLVAVKTLTFQDRTVAGGKSQHVALMEAAISSSLAHPYVVTTYSFDIKPLKVDHPDTVPGLKIVSGQVTDWKLFIVQEYCDAGSLRQAVLRRRMWDKKTDQPDILSVVECALELASGLAHLHQHNIIHGDLNPNNVLLKNDPNSRRGVVCKLCDFGLSVKMGDGQSHISNMRRGTPFYAAPEVMSKGNMTKAADCYSFGVMMWELYHSTTCYRALPDRSFQQRDEYPRFFGGCPREYSSLAEACTSERVASRPPMSTVVERLQALLARVSGAHAEPRDL